MMRVVFDTCVLVPSVMRSMLLAAAELELIEFVISPRILGEWARAAANRDALDQVEAEQAIGRLRLQFPNAIRSDVKDIAQYWLPDADDIHVLALAVTTSADVIVTVNGKDFPKSELATYGIERLTPDQVLCRMLDEALAEKVAEIIGEVQSALPGLSQTQIFAKAWLPQLGRKYAGLVQT